MYIKKTTMLFVNLIILGFCFSTVTAELSVENITIDPNEPTEFSDVTITCIINDLDEEDDVYLWLEECNENIGICDPETINISMSETSNQNEYSATATLKFDGATYFTYRFIVNDNGEWTTIKDDDNYHVDLSEKSTDNGTNGGSDNNDSPGFEIAILIAAIFTVIMIYKKKR